MSDEIECTGAHDCPATVHILGCYNGPAEVVHVPGKFVKLDGGTTDVGIAGHPDTSPQSEFVNDRVFLRAPAGTDPLAVMREAMSVFMEKRDGTNVLPWWRQKRWWHGGAHGLRRGERLLPPSLTGKLPGLDGTDVDAVYLTTERTDALLYCARHDRPALYEVLVDHEPQADPLLPAGQSWTVTSARVHRMEQPSRAELTAVLDTLLGPMPTNLLDDQ